MTTNRQSGCARIGRVLAQSRRTRLVLLVVACVGLNTGPATSQTRDGIAEESLRFGRPYRNWPA